MPSHRVAMARIDVLNLTPVQTFFEELREALRLLPTSKDLDVPGADYNWAALEARVEIEESLLKLRRAGG